MGQKKFEEEVEIFKKIQKDLSKATSLRSQQDGRLNENKVVKEEMDLLEADATVFKLIGPALVRQDREEAQQKLNVMKAQWKNWKRNKTLKGIQLIRFKNRCN